VQFGPPPKKPVAAVPVPEAKPAPRVAKPKAKACPERSRRIDPALVAKARELRDRYLEHVNDRALAAPTGKYDVSRTLSQAEGSRSLAVNHNPMPLLEAG
jgi:hypothetical protein